jgi:hypothetical protein
MPCEARLVTRYDAQSTGSGGLRVTRRGGTVRRDSQLKTGETTLLTRQQMVVATTLSAHTSQRMMRCHGWHRRLGDGGSPPEGLSSSDISKDGGMAVASMRTWRIARNARRKGHGHRMHCHLRRKRWENGLPGNGWPSSTSFSVDLTGIGNTGRGLWINVHAEEDQHICRAGSRNAHARAWSRRERH